MEILTRNGGLSRLGCERAREIHALMKSLCTEATVPPGFELTLADVEQLFNTDGHGIFIDVCGVFGANDEKGNLFGVVALQPLRLDDQQFLEFMIFFDTTRSSSGMALDAASTVSNGCRKRVPNPIATLVFHKNSRAKAFYAKAGFEFNRNVLCEGHQLELWIFQPEAISCTTRTQ
jgi:hypothetical protein